MNDVSGAGIIIKGDSRSCAALKVCPAIMPALKSTDLHYDEDEHVHGIYVVTGATEKCFELPVRVGEMLDYILSYLSEESVSRAPRFLHFGADSLDLYDGLFTFGDTVRKPVRLTEKEVAILRFLSENKGRSVERKMLLSAVWGYAEGVETHTLETHIYRLRQKIEKDPAQPLILLTDEDGTYHIG